MGETASCSLISIRMNFAAEEIQKSSSGVCLTYILVRRGYVCAGEIGFFFDYCLIFIDNLERLPLLNWCYNGIIRKLKLEAFYLKCSLQNLLL